VEIILALANVISEERRKWTKKKEDIYYITYENYMICRKNFLYDMNMIRLYDLRILHMEENLVYGGGMKCLYDEEDRHIIQ